MMNYLILISTLVFPTVANAQMAMTTDNHSLTQSTANPPLRSPAYSWQPNTSDGATQGWQSTVPSSGVARGMITEWEEVE